MSKTASSKALQTATSAIAAVSREIDRLPSRLDFARRGLVRLGDKGVRQMRRHPLAALVGAFAVGVAATKLAQRG
jgi:hypothetical protein